MLRCSIAARAVAGSIPSVVESHDTWGCDVIWARRPRLTETGPDEGSGPRLRVIAMGEATKQSVEIDNVVRKR